MGVAYDPGDPHMIGVAGQEHCSSSSARDRNHDVVPEVALLELGMQSRLLRERPDRVPCHKQVYGVGNDEAVRLEPVDDSFSDRLGLARGMDAEQQLGAHHGMEIDRTDERVQEREHICRTGGEPRRIPSYGPPKFFNASMARIRASPLWPARITLRVIFRP